MVRLYVCALMLLLPLTMTHEAGTRDFSGSYTLTTAKYDSKSGKDVIETLTVVQTANAVEITRVLNGKSNTNRFPLDGAGGVYFTENQTKGTCKGRVKGNHLFLEASVTTRPLKDGPIVTLRTRERWELSPDLKTLKIHTEMDNPDLPIHLFDPWTDVYTRN
jgi:hypothetical protein